MGYHVQCINYCSIILSVIPSPNTDTIQYTGYLKNSVCIKLYYMLGCSHSVHISWPLHMSSATSV